MTARRRYRIGVVGFGIAGAATAYLLARTGHSVTLIERAPHVGPIGAGLLLQPVGQAVLERMGLLDRVLAGGAPVEELHAVRQDGRDLIRLPYPSGLRAYGVHRGALFAALFGAVHSQSIDVRLGCAITGIQVRDDQPVLTDATGAQHGPFDFIVAADGSRSTVRSLAGLRARVLPYDHGALWITGACQAIRDRLYQVCHGTQKLLGILPIGGGRCSLYWGIPVRDLDSVRADGIGPFKDELIHFCPESRELVEPITSFDQLVSTAYRHVWMPRLYTRHALVLGDAAHATSPHLGQGGGLALLDAWTFADCVHRAPDHFSAFRLFARRRAAQLRYYNWMTFLLSPFFQADGWLKGKARDIGLPLMPRIGWVRRQMQLTMCGWKRGWLGGRLAI
ncbi:MAG TPA: NAD(P)/FAD-dependent oxidoreductase [Gemmataceae bacterium]|nr:NAD(P)/FAD-dependent oxidoreductase [Gemmataceae bacterium]